MRIFRPSGLCWRGLFTKATKAAKAAGASTAKKMILEAAEDPSSDLRAPGARGAGFPGPAADLRC
jgi:hypothetical protein